MIKYAVVEIAGRQFLVEPGKELLVNNLGDVKKLECDKVLLLGTDKGIDLGAPYLKERLNFEVSEPVKGKKIRVSKYSAKANTRRVIGSRSIMSKIKLANSSKSVKSDD